jgi:hypothetical protein
MQVTIAPSQKREIDALPPKREGRESAAVARTRPPAAEQFSIRGIVSVRYDAAETGTPGGSRSLKRQPVAYTGLIFPESNERKVITDGCTGKADIIVFSVCNDPSIGRIRTKRPKENLIHLISTFLSDVCAKSVEKSVFAAGESSCAGLEIDSRFG